MRAKNARASTCAAGCVCPTGEHSQAFKEAPLEIQDLSAEEFPERERLDKIESSVPLLSQRDPPPDALRLQNIRDLLIGRSAL
jgi:hypothetical protein